MKKLVLGLIGLAALIIVLSSSTAVGQNPHLELQRIEIDKIVDFSSVPVGTTFTHTEICPDNGVVIGNPNTGDIYFEDLDTFNTLNFGAVLINNGQGVEGTFLKFQVGPSPITIQFECIVLRK